MMLQPVKDINEYKRIKETLKGRFEAERTGDQDLFREQSKILQPLINTQQQTVKAIKDGQEVNATAVSNALLPLTREMQRRNDQVDLLTEQPFYHQELPAIAPITPTSPDIVVDFDAGLSETDKENLQDMSFELPSIVFKHKELMEATIENIKTEKRSIGQFLGKGAAGKKIPTKDKEMHESRKKTLDIYREIILGLEGAKKFVSTPKKTGKGLKKIVDVIYYSDLEDLCNKLAFLQSAKQAGNNGVDNNINSILDELLRVQAIDKDEYDNLYKNIFG